jgi:ubiquinone/menaquinone biosynthesis C-methylase UbiE
MRKPAKNKWAKGWYKKRIIEERKYLWEPEYVALLAKWVGFKQGQTVVDVGCGLGYLGTLYWQYFGKGGKYCGVDISPKLITEAKKLSRNWAKGGTAEFKVGDAYQLPYPDDYADVVMCQTLLLHLSDQQKAVNEMFRILKPGGIALCKEPDHLSMALQHSISSMPELPMKDKLFFQKMSYICARGREKLGLGISDTAPHVPLWLKEAGFKQIDAKTSSQPFFMIPPYETPKQKYDISWWKESFQLSERPSEKKMMRNNYKKTFFAGGGTQSDYNKYLIFLHKKYPARRKLYMQQLNNGTYYLFSAKQFFIIKGCKPK